MSEKQTKNFLSKHFRVQLLSPQSPELNPIETIFAELKKEVQNQNVKNVKKLILVIKSSWKKMKKDFIKKTIKHTSKVCSEIIKCHGGNNFN